jgi:hypothetical protein
VIPVAAAGSQRSASLRLAVSLCRCVTVSPWWCRAYAKACAAMTAMHVRPAAEVSLVRSPSMATTRIGDVLLSRTVCCCRVRGVGGVHLAA